MEFQEGSFKAKLITIGRSSGKEHIVELRAVYYNQKFYFSRRNPDSDWLKNALLNPNVRIKLNGETLVGCASLVTDNDVCKKISCLKYSDKRSEESRIVLEVTPRV